MYITKEWQEIGDQALFETLYIAFHMLLFISINEDQESRLLFRHNYCVSSTVRVLSVHKEQTMHKQLVYTHIHLEGPEFQSTVHTTHSPTMTSPYLARVMPTQILFLSVTKPRFALCHPMSAGNLCPRESVIFSIFWERTVDSSTIPYSDPDNVWVHSQYKTIEVWA